MWTLAVGGVLEYASAPSNKLRYAADREFYNCAFHLVQNITMQAEGRVVNNSFNDSLMLNSVRSGMIS
jgi:hypothetical protein